MTEINGEWLSEGHQWCLYKHRCSHEADDIKNIVLNKDDFHWKFWWDKYSVCYIEITEIFRVNKIARSFVHYDIFWFCFRLCVNFRSKDFSSTWSNPWKFLIDFNGMLYYRLFIVNMSDCRIFKQSWTSAMWNTVLLRIGSRVAGWAIYVCACIHVCVSRYLLNFIECITRPKFFGVQWESNAKTITCEAPTYI